MISTFEILKIVSREIDEINICNLPHPNTLFVENRSRSGVVIVRMDQHNNKVYNDSFNKKI